MTLSIADLLAHLERHGVILTADGDDLRVDAPAGAITPAMRATLTERKAELLAYLAGTTEIIRIPLGWGRWSPEHGGLDLHGWLTANGLRVVGGESHFGGEFRPVLYLVDAASEVDA